MLSVPNIYTLPCDTAGEIGIFMSLFWQTNCKKLQNSVFQTCTKDFASSKCILFSLEGYAVSKVQQTRVVYLDYLRNEIYLYDTSLFCLSFWTETCKLKL